MGGACVKPHPLVPCCHSWSTSVCIGFAGPDDLPAVLICLNECGVVTRWRKIGIFLGLRYSVLKVIEKDETDEEDRLTAMLDRWLRAGKATKEALMNAMKNVR